MIIIVDKNGEIFPVSNKYSERVLLIFLKIIKNIDKEKNINFFFKTVMKFLNL